MDLTALKWSLFLGSSTNQPIGDGADRASFITVLYESEGPCPSCDYIVAAFIDTITIALQTTIRMVVEWSEGAVGE